MVPGSAVTQSQLLTQELLIERSAHDLDWPLLLDRIAQYSTTAKGGRRLRALTPASSLEEAQRMMHRTRETLSLSDEGLAIPCNAVPDLGDLIDRLERSLVATGLELRDLTLVLEQGSQLRSFAQSQQQQRPLLAEILFSEPTLNVLLERLKRSIESNGSLSDQASAALARGREKVREARQELLTQLKRLLLVHGDLLRDSYYSEREGHYVLPVRADAHRGIEGTVLDTSASGNTLFVEPRELTAHSNRLRVALAEVTHEERRLLRELSILAQGVAPALRIAEQACVEADVLSALARYAHQHAAVPIVPTQEKRFDLRNARHPLLVCQGLEVVASDLGLRPGQVLVISGPNAGGKTVTLKAFGLFAMMAQTGLPMTVDVESSIGYFSDIFCEIGDSQSIASSLSTFSAHVLVLASVLANCREGSLVLLDEVAGGTDPEQGAALAIAYLDALVEQGAAVVSTTHYEALKELSSHNPRYRSAAVGFDVSTMMPSFRLLLDVTGPSTAFAVATRFGIPKSIVERAQSIVPKSSREREALLEQLATERNAALTARRDAERDADEQRRLRFELEQERAKARTTFERQLEVEYGELVGRIRVARADLDNLRKRIQKDVQEPGILNRADLTLADRTVDMAAHVVALGSPVAEAVRNAKMQSQGGAQHLSLESLTVGKKVHLPRLGCDAEILEISRKGMLKVRAGSIALSVAFEEVTASCGTKPTSGSTAQNRAKTNRKDKSNTADAVVSHSPASRVSHNTLDLRGERVDAALDKVDAFIDELLRRGEPAGFVLHGHGTGALKQAVREHVRSLRQVRESAPAAPEDGGDAFTLLWLSD